LIVCSALGRDRKEQRESEECNEASLSRPNVVFHWTRFEFGSRRRSDGAPALWLLGSCGGEPQRTGHSK
jgi:hypothetical protein